MGEGGKAPTNADIRTWFRGSVYPFPIIAPRSSNSGGCDARASSRGSSEAATRPSLTLAAPASAAPDLGKSRFAEMRRSQVKNPPPPPPPPVNGTGEGDLATAEEASLRLVVPAAAAAAGRGAGCCLCRCAAGAEAAAVPPCPAAVAAADEEAPDDPSSSLLLLWFPCCFWSGRSARSGRAKAVRRPESACSMGGAQPCPPRMRPAPKARAGEGGARGAPQELFVWWRGAPSAGYTAPRPECTCLRQGHT